MKKIIFFLFLICTVSASRAQNQQIVVTGVVTGARDHLPLWGASVIVKGTSTGVQTDSVGRYVLPIYRSRFAYRKAIVTFSFVGFSTKEVKIRVSKNDTIVRNVKLKSKGLYHDIS